MLQKELEVGTTAVKSLIFNTRKKSNIAQIQIQQQLGFVISHFSFDLRNFYFVFSKEAVRHKTLKHTFLTELVNNVT